jgi:hypothetical protein
MPGAAIFPPVAASSKSAALTYSDYVWARHPSQRTSELRLVDGLNVRDSRLDNYPKIDDHTALVARVKNGSYKFRIFNTADELVSRSLGKMDAREVGMISPR